MSGLSRSEFHLPRFAVRGPRAARGGPRSVGAGYDNVQVTLDKVKSPADIDGPLTAVGQCDDSDQYFIQGTRSKTLRLRPGRLLPGQSAEPGVQNNAAVTHAKTS